LAIVLAGGYGRGQGGVLKTETGDQPYNDLEFYVFLHGNGLLNDGRFREPLNHLGEALSATARLHVEFKVEARERLRNSPVSMFSYDLLSGHRIILGPSELFAGCAHHLRAENIDASEATRLLFNRCTGLLLVEQLLRQSALTDEQADFAGRNLAKAQLAFGDALLTVFGQYHWSVLERQQRLQKLALNETLPWLNDIRRQHQRGVEFKLHPRRVGNSPDSLRTDHRQTAGLALDLWLWLESKRLHFKFKTPHEYAFHGGQKCAGTRGPRNFLLNLRTFGIRAALDPMAARYPRERLFNALALLLWNGEAAQDRQVRRHLRRQLHSNGADWESFVAAYKQIWARYG
jgi:hypothetical protein